MPKYKLTYFDVYGRGELSRLIFAAAKVDFEDDRVTLEEWPKRKAEMPFNQLPVLYIDDKPPLAQSGAMERYLATTYGLNGDNTLDAAYCEMIVDTINDVFFKLPLLEKDEKVKAEKTKEQWDEKILPALKRMDKDFAKSKQKFLVGDKLSYADLHMMQVLIFSQNNYPQYLKEIPALISLRDRVMELDGVKQYLATRKQCPF